MCEPTTMVMLGVAVMGAIGAKKQGDASAQAGNANAQIQANNAEIKRRQAVDAVDRGETNAENKRLETRLLIARQRAAFAANGVLVDEGSALDLTSDTAEAGELDALMILNNAEREAQGLESQAVNFDNQGNLDRFRGQSAQSAGNLQALTTLGKGLGGAATKIDFGGPSSSNAMLAASGGPSFQQTRMY